jgi:hypothetical protein
MLVRPFQEEFLFRSFEKGQSALPCLPPVGASLLLRALFKRAHRAPAGRQAALQSDFLIAPYARPDVERYNAALGFGPGSTPLTYHYLAVQRAHLLTMLAPAFPYRIAGMVHVENALVLHAELPDAAMRLSTRIDILPPTGSGAIHCALVTEGRCGDTLVFACTSNYLAQRGTRRGATAPSRSPSPIQEGAAIGGWPVPRSAGRAYARVSGDWNPIHLAGWSARLLGLRAPIIHGMHSVGKAAAQLERWSGQRVTAISVRFRAPVPLGAAVVLMLGAAPDTYALVCQGTLAAQGSYRLALP